jgi:ion channel-forming bestrophin family protein
MINYTPESWFRMLFKLQGSVLPRLFVRIIIGLMISVFVIYIHTYYYPINVTTTIHKLIAVALGLLLVFRTNASYDRYWAGWRLIGELTFHTQDLFRKFCIYTKVHVDQEKDIVSSTNPEKPSTPAYHEDVKTVQSLLKAMQRVVLLSIEDDDDYSTLNEYLSADQIQYLQNTDRAFRFSVILAWISQEIHELSQSIPDPLKNSLDMNLSQLSSVMMEIKRIQQTPIPFAYAQHLKIFLVIFCYTLPVALVSQMGGWTIIASCISTFALFGIDEIGVEIEDPFGDDPNDLPIGETLLLSEKALDQLHDCLVLNLLSIK